MGFIEMLVANKRLNTMSEAFFEKVHRLERLINTNGGVNEGDQKVFCSPSFGLPTPPPGRPKSACGKSLRVLYYR